MMLTRKLSLFFLLVSITSIVTIAVASFITSSKIIENETSTHLATVNLLKEAEVVHWVEDSSLSLEVLAKYPAVTDIADANEDAQNATASNNEASINGILQKYKVFNELFILRLEDGKIMFSTDKAQEGKFREDQPYYIEGRNHTFVQDVYYSFAILAPSMGIGTPILDESGKKIGVLVGRLDLNRLSDIIQQTAGFHKSENTYLVNTFNFFVTEPLAGKDYVLNKAIYTDGVIDALAGNSGEMHYNDYRGIPVIGSYRWMPEFNMAIITEIEYSEAYAPIRSLSILITILGLILALVGAFVGWRIAKSVTKPLQNLVKGVEQVGQGNLEYQIMVSGNDEVASLSKSFNEMSKNIHDNDIKLKTANEELEAFAYSVSHDLRSPLRALAGFSEVLLSGYGDTLDEQGNHYLERIQAASHRMGELIDDLLKLSRVTRTELTFKPLDLRLISRDILNRLKESEPSRQVEIKIDDSLQVYGDLHLMQLVMENLLNNAWKFTGKVPNPVIQVGKIKQNGRYIYFVKDNGAGFDMSYANKLFSPFQRLHTNSEFPGNGIGLATVKRIISRHGGETWAEGVSGKGATFYFTVKEEVRNEREDYPISGRQS